MVDVSEIVAFKPDRDNKRHTEESENKSKKVKFEEHILKDENQLLPDFDDGEDFDENTLKKLLLLFEKRNYKNQELRIKFADYPEKFLDSEVNLHGVIHEMHVISTVPQLYYILVELNTINSLVTLLSHENTDISTAIVDLLQEMTDISISEGLDDDESMDSYLQFIDTLLNAQIIQCLVQNMDRLDELIKEESAGVFNSLGIIENLSEIYPNLCKEGTQNELLTWILKRFKLKIPFDSNKLYASEILAIFLQNNENNRAFVGTSGGIDILLRQLAMYKRHNPDSSEEYEYMCNLFDCLSLCLVDVDNRLKFLQGEGLQLMNLMLREKKQSRCGAIKILNHALLFTNITSGTANTEPLELSNGEYDKNLEVVRQCSNKFIEILGLRTIFPLFMKTPVFSIETTNNNTETSRKHKGKSVVVMSKSETEEHVFSILASLARCCTDQPRERFISKFLENDLSKVDRLVEMHFQYLNKVARFDMEIEIEKQRLLEEDEIIDEAMEEEFYLKRLENGLFTLQMIDYIMLEICNTKDRHPEIHDRVISALSLRKGSVKTIKDIILEYSTNLGDGETDETQSNFRQHLAELMKNF